MTISSFASSSLGTKGVIPLPSERAYSNEGQGWHGATTVKQSTIPEAGYGRFSDVDVPKNTVIMTKPIIPMTEVSSIHSLASDVILLLKNEEDAEKLISLYETEGQQTRDNIMRCLAHFAFPHPDLDGVYMNMITCSTNHGNLSEGRANCRFLVNEDGCSMITKTLTDVKAGDELLCDYRDFGQTDEFWAQFCKKEGLMDAISNLKHYIDM